MIIFNKKISRKKSQILTVFGLLFIFSSFYVAHIFNATKFNDEIALFWIIASAVIFGKDKASNETGVFYEK